MNRISGFAEFSNADRILAFGWFLHVYRSKEWFGTGDIRQCYEFLHISTPNISDVLARLSNRKPALVLRKGFQYKLERRVRTDYDKKYGNRPVTIEIEKALEALPARLSDETKRKYLVEALNCLRAQCFRAAILMSWNLCYDHLLHWLLAEPSRLSKFNSKLPNRPPFTTGLIVANREDFEWLGEREVVDICGHKTVAVVTDNMKKILLQSLDWRNMSAHPATIEIKQVTAEHTVYNLVENIVLHLN